MLSQTLKLYFDSYYNILKVFLFVFLKITVCFFLMYLFLLFILFLAVLGLRCCAQAFSSCGKQGLLFVAVRGLLIAVASLVAELGL